MKEGEVKAGADAGGQRLDTWLALLKPEESRSRWQQLIRGGHVRLNDKPVKGSHTMTEGDLVSYSIPEPQPVDLQPEAIPLSILYEDPHMVVIDKPPALVVHPAPGHEQHTLVNALLHHCDNLGGIGGELRPGIVHRLDKDTSGVLVVAKTDAAMRGLVAAFKERQVRKVYLALVWGLPEPPADTLESRIGRHPNQRQKMAVDVDGGRHAVTHYQMVEAYEQSCLLEVRIETGRTHQIRVHMAAMQHPVMGDKMYGRKHPDFPVARQMLHARELSLDHPITGQSLEFSAPIPDDMCRLIRQLRGDPDAA